MESSNLILFWDKSSQLSDSSDLDQREEKTAQEQIYKTQDTKDRSERIATSV